MKPSIACRPNGPYVVTNPSPPDTRAKLHRPAGVALESGTQVFLCRCGGSKNKPFCDGTHKTNGFSDRNETDAAKNQRKAYVGPQVTIFDNRAICAHAGACTEGLKEVFREDAKPWIDPTAATVERIAAAIEKCPSGALSYAIGGVEAKRADSPAAILVSENGPYAVSGGIELNGVAFGEGAPGDHYTLCRCGASKNKPFCDGSHWNAGFRDP
jgi:CDGSH-type Zn-finger protein